MLANSFLATARVTALRLPVSSFRRHRSQDSRQSIGQARHQRTMSLSNYPLPPAALALPVNCRKKTLPLRSAWLHYCAMLSKSAGELLFAVLALAFLSSCGGTGSLPPGPAGCVRDVDCKGDRVCITGSCLPPGGGGGGDVTPDLKMTVPLDAAMGELGSPPDFSAVGDAAMAELGCCPTARVRS